MVDIDANVIDQMSENGAEEVEIQGENAFKGKTITAGILLDTLTKPGPRMKKEYVEEVAFER